MTVCKLIENEGMTEMNVSVEPDEPDITVHSNQKLAGYKEVMTGPSSIWP